MKERDELTFPTPSSFDMILSTLPTQHNLFKPSHSQCRSAIPCRKSLVSVPSTRVRERERELKLTQGWSWPVNVIFRSGKLWLIFSNNFVICFGRGFVAFMGPRGPEETSERERISRVKVLSYDENKRARSDFEWGVGRLEGEREREGKCLLVTKTLCRSSTFLVFSSFRRVWRRGKE